MSRKPKVTKLDAAMIAVRHAASHGVAAAGPPEVRSHHDGTWSVFVPNGSHTDPGGLLVIVDQHSGEARLFPTL